MALATGASATLVGAPVSSSGLSGSVCLVSRATGSGICRTSRAVVIAVGRGGVAILSFVLYRMVSLSTVMGVMAVSSATCWGVLCSCWSAVVVVSVSAGVGAVARANSLCFVSSTVEDVGVTGA